MKFIFHKKRKVERTMSYIKSLAAVMMTMLVLSFIVETTLGEVVVNTYWACVALYFHWSITR